MDKNGTPIINIESLNKDFRSLSVLDNISFAVGLGEFVSIVGPSGCGKSTLLKIIGGILKPTSGSLKFKDTYSILNGEFGFVFQNPVLLPWRTLVENINLPLELLDKENYYNISELIDILGLKGFEGYLPRQLSGGMQQRVALARALVFKPSVLLMDEPFGALDELTRDKMKYEVMEVCNKLSTTSIMVTHNIPEAVLMSDRVILLSERPAKIVKVFDIKLTKPRNHQIEISSEFIKQVEEIRECL